jgi:hypothetical protein
MKIMAESMPADPRSRTGPRLKYLGFSVLAVGLLSICLLIGGAVFLATRIVPVITPLYGGVPHISGTVVDAATGQPVQEMDVCLVARARGLNGIRVGRSEVTQSDASGKFSFAPSVQRGWGFAGYEIGITDPAAQLSFSCGKFPDVLTNPGFVQGSTLPFGDDRKRFYFPVAIIQGLLNDPNDHTQYGPMLQKFTNPGSIRIALIPLFENESACEAIQDPTNAAFCRWLNSSGDAAILRKRRRPSPNNR